MRKKKHKTLLVSNLRNIRQVFAWSKDRSLFSQIQIQLLMPTVDYNPSSLRLVSLHFRHFAGRARLQGWWNLCVCVCQLWPQLSYESLKTYTFEEERGFKKSYSYFFTRLYNPQNSLISLLICSICRKKMEHHPKLPSPTPSFCLWPISFA